MAVKHRRVHKSNKILTRKQQRKEKRQEKKIRRNEHYTNRNKPGQYVLNPNSSNNMNITNQKAEKNNTKGKIVNIHVDNASTNKVLTTEELRQKEQREQKKIQKQMMKQRNKQLLQANIVEDRNIKQLEKQLKLNKRKSKSIPKTFSEDGLDYLLEVCDSETMKSAVTTEQELNEVNNEFEEDFALMSGKTIMNGDDNFEDFLNEDDVSNDDVDIEGYNSDDKSEVLVAEENESVDNDEHFSENYDSSSSDNEVNVKKRLKMKGKKSIKKVKSKRNNQSDDDISDDLEEDISYENFHAGIHEEKAQKTKKRKLNKLNENCVKNKESKLSSDEENSEIEYSDDNDSEPENNSTNSDDVGTKSIVKKNTDETWEDIYGRLRSKDGKIITKNGGKYVPPAIRAKLETCVPGDKKRLDKLNRLKKQIKGLLNRLAESNMHNISSQIEELYMNNSRNDMNETLTNLVIESLISLAITPERLLMEHVMLITVLHANVGTEVGAHFLQSIIKKFDEYVNAYQDVENKTLDNIVNILSQLYNFKLFDAKLLYEILNKLSSKFEEKDVECILNILKSVGFTLRKDDPLALKNLILDLQKRAASASEEVRDNPRVKFMLDVLLAIKNNNVTKIPNYDTSYSEHLKKIMKGFIRKGNYVTQLNISLGDLLKADERGKWWIVGSAWIGNAPENDDKSKTLNKAEGFSEKLLELARKQRMNTDTRRNVFCIIMSAEDYLDAFEKLLRLGLKNQQEREIINVILHCCLQEKVYNPYYAVLAQKFCEFDRKYQMTIKCSIWDKLKSLDDHSGSQISNLAKMLTHLFLEKGLPISTLKIVQFSELDKVTLRFIRQILLGILLHKDEDSCVSVFEKVAHSDKLKLFRDSLRLFIHHFLLKNLKLEGGPEYNKSLLETRAKMIERILISKEGKMKF